MKKEFAERPEKMTKLWPGELTSFSWEDFVTAIPSPLFVVTTYKSNGRENACLQSWSTFVGDSGVFVCLLGSVSRRGHLYRSLQESGCCVLNFPSRDIYGKCYRTIENNDWEKDEITLSGLTAERAVSVNAPRIAECFLNIECELLWVREHFPASRDVTVALKATHIAMDSSHFDEGQLGRYGKTGYMYNLHAPCNPDTGERLPDGIGSLEIYP